MGGGISFPLVRFASRSLAASVALASQSARRKDVRRAPRSLYLRQTSQVVRPSSPRPEGIIAAGGGWHGVRRPVINCVVMHRGNALYPE